MYRTQTMAVAFLAGALAAALLPASAEEEAAVETWQIGTPIVTYWAGPAMTDAVAQQMKDGGFNLVWCGEKDFDLVARHDLRGMLTDGLISPASLDDPAKKAQLDALIDRVKGHPALEAYFITDEPNASTFPSWGKLIAYLRERDPAHLAYLNLFPTYASNEQLGTKGDTVTAYREHLRQYVEIVKPALISYDHYHFATGGGDGDQYFLNLGMIREAALEAKVPFLNIVQAATWTPSMRVPTREEMRFLIYTTLAYGGQGISYYVYCWPGHTGAIANPDGTPTVIYHALKVLNREFVAIASQLQPLKSLGAYHTGMMPLGGQPLPANCAFRFDPPVEPMAYKPPEKMRGIVLGLFGAGRRPSAAVVVNLDYTKDRTVTIVGPGPLEVFDARTGRWVRSRRGDKAALHLLPGGGKLVRVGQ
jgi:hypothetical protein